MKNRKQKVFLPIFVLTAGIAVTTAHGLAQTQLEFPNKPIRLLVGFPAGGGQDTTARAIGQKLEDAWGYPVVVDNRPGATGTIAVGIAARAAPDGYTVCMISASQSINAATNPKLPFNLTEDLAPVSLVSSWFFVLYHSPSVPVKSVRELIAYAKANPGKLYYGASGHGSLNHLAWEMFSHMTGTELVHVPFKSSTRATIAVAAGDVQLGFANLIALRPHMRSDRLRLLAMTAKERSPAVPELPTLAEAGVPGYELYQWNGVVTGAKVSPATIRKLNAGIAGAMNAPEVVRRLQADGSTPVSSSPEEFGAHIKSEMARWRKLVTDAGLNLY